MAGEFIVLIVFDADNAFAAEDVVRAAQVHRGSRLRVCIAGAPPAAKRVADTVVRLSAAGVTHSAIDARIVPAGGQIADDMMVDCALRLRAQSDGPMTIVLLSADKGLHRRLDVIAPTTVMAPESAGQSRTGHAFSLLLHAVDVDGQAHVEMHHAALCSHILDAFLAGSPACAQRKRRRAEIESMLRSIGAIKPRSGTTWTINLSVLRAYAELEQTLLA